MAIVRAARPQSHFYLLNKAISEDRRLSWSARGLLVFLLGKPDHWEVSVANLVNETQDSLRGAGGHTKRDGVKVLLNELMQAGYMRRSDKPKHNADGSFAGYDYLVSETPIDPSADDSPSTDYPSTAEPSTALPSTANTTQVSIEEKQGLNRSKDLFGSGDAGAPPAAGKKSAQKKSPATTAEAWEAYRTSYQKQYGVEPLRNAKVNTALKNIVSQVGAENALKVIEHYLGMKGYYAERQHEIGVLASDLQKVWNLMHSNTARAASRERPVTSADFRAIDYRSGISANGTL